MTTLIRARCHCGLNTFSICFNTESLPFVHDLCHCSSCRHSTGQLMLNFIQFEGVPLSDGTTAQPADLSNLTRYQTSNFATRRFCSRCSCHILWVFNNTDTPVWHVAVATLDRAEGISRLGYHIFIADTLDGGIANNVRTIDGVDLPRYAQSLKEGKLVPQDWRSLRADDDNEVDEHTYLAAYCHCKAVSLWITRPSSASYKPSSPYPDLLYPYNVTPEATIANPTDEKWWLRPIGATQPTRYLAGHCACTTCRLTSGCEIQSWAFIPRANIFFRRSGAPTLADGAPTTEDLVGLNLQEENTRPLGLKSYRSSHGRTREFCATCGATIFWRGNERPDLVDVSVALMDEKQVGARAEGWLEWHKGRVSFEEDAINKPLVHALVEGLIY